VALATPDALFGLTEVRVGVAPTPISTHMVHAMGLRHTRRYALTGERFGRRRRPARIGLVHEVVAADADGTTRLAEVLDAVFLAAPGRDRGDQGFVPRRQQLLLDDREMAMLAHESWMQRNSAEGQEGTSAFREKRRPAWYRPTDA
jgi:methylglutaconyl-CoA hydratase